MGTVDPAVEVCAECGVRGMRPRSIWERFRRWYVSGGGMPRAYVCRSCGAEWGQGGGLVVLSHRAGWQRRFGVPAALVNALRHERSWEPVPSFYTIVGLAAAGLVAVPAALNRWGRGWLWPMVAAAGAVVGTFGLSIGSGFRGGAATFAMRRVVAPRRAAAAELAWEIAALRRHASQATLLVPARWDGDVALGGAGWSGSGDHDRRLTSLSVVAESDATVGPPPRLDILHELEPIPEAIVDEQVIDQIVGCEASRSMTDLAALDFGKDRQQEAAWVARFVTEQRARERQLEAVWETDTITVDGRPVAARTIRGDGVQATTFTHAGRPIIVTAVQAELSQIALQTTHNIEPLLDDLIRRRTASLDR